MKNARYTIKVDKKIKETKIDRTNITRKHDEEALGKSSQH